jgi:hypothetical protein|tara:strand:+ start:2396 stop:2731 length:336 start_codon:yes stop_codon:yes gene_type:complete
MSKILQTQLPLASNSVTPDLFNKLSRILEINLGAVDVNSTQQVNDGDKLKFNFLAGSIIWNTTLGVLQVYTGNKWVDIGERTNNLGFEASADLGKVDIKIAGDIAINVASF